LRAHGLEHAQAGELRFGDAADVALLERGADAAEGQQRRRYATHRVGFARSDCVAGKYTLRELAKETSD
jgi:cytosine/adenosine deaminase-related metal-dependent hydrolase